MIKKIKEFIAKRKQLNQQKEQLKKMKEYYQIVQNGAYFLRFIYDDLAKMKKEQFNRKQRRRFVVQLEQKGQFNREIIDFYSKRVDEILTNINNQKGDKSGRN